MTEPGGVDMYTIFVVTDTNSKYELTMLLISSVELNDVPDE